MEPIWLRVMQAFTGLQEIPGLKSNPVILHWVKLLNAPAWYDNDDKPWCAIGLNIVFWTCHIATAWGKTKPDGEPMDRYGVFRARSFETWGIPLTIPTRGCVMVFIRPEGGHVGLYLGERKDAYYVLGMNQSNSVGPAWIHKSRLTAIRWPADTPVVTTGRLWVNMTGEISTDEA